ncbi:reductive dehalogenase [Parendozoicomonas haliclonae]|uniref:3-chloro-4-hydroxyphenylacetate reductive dehalogenase n=1 Tax=Parendozoicomonas haliclonae TaxID=1960125 RepID=A0A1X7ARI1_9GAMM|nr:reductive dehalogenase [Parendozoicomonas haliclonae]SMA50845.1 3-chloro-4-hydroxyphenylacetate reductive dehalogenase precursor [Parendozoicomonas haliclonae]
MSDRNNDAEAPVQATGINRRGLLKFSAFGGLAGAATALAATTPMKAMASTSATEESNAHLFTEHDEFPVKVADDYQRYHQERTAFHYFYKTKGTPYMPLPPDESKPGFTVIDSALAGAGWDLCDRLNGMSSNTGYDVGLYNWDNPTYPQQYPFESKELAANVIKRAARTFGANLVGITRQDDRWDYASFYDAIKNETKTWDDFPFKPKTVIVMAIESDYEGQSTAPSATNDGIIGEGYARMSYVAYGMASFLRNLGYKAVASGNDLGMSVPYAMAAGIGEASRMGLLVTYNMGPRIRLMKVYTDLEFVEYDKPKTFGVRDFCERCKRCSDACPSKAISVADKPSLYPPADHDAATNAVGIEKWWTDSKKCLQYWNDSGTNCGTCVTACPYNKPDFWQHRMIEKMNSLMPGPLHTFMREMDIWFGFGDTFDEKAVAKFWDPAGRKYDGRG